MYHIDPTSGPASEQAGMPAVEPKDESRSMSAPQSTSLNGLMRRMAKPRFLVMAMSLIAVIALAISVYMSYVGLTGSEVAGCGGGGAFSCDHVLTSRWSKVLGIPVGVPATGMYVGLVGLLLMLVARGDRRWAWNLVGVATASATAAGIWFIGLQVFAIGHLCPYCLGVHTCGIVLFGLYLGLRRPAIKPLVGSVGLSVLGVGGMIGAQVMTPPPPTYRIEEPVFVAISDDLVEPFASPSSPGPASLAGGPATAGTDEFGAPGEFGAPSEFGVPGEAAEFGAPGEFDAPAEFGAPMAFDAPTEFEAPAEFAAPAEFGAPIEFDAPAEFAAPDSSVASSEPMGSPTELKTPVESDALVEVETPMGADVPAVDDANTRGVPRTASGELGGLAAAMTPDRATKFEEPREIQKSRSVGLDIATLSSNLAISLGRFSAIFTSVAGDVIAHASNSLPPMDEVVAMVESAGDAMPEDDEQVVMEESFYELPAPKNWNPDRPVADPAALPEPINVSDPVDADEASPFDTLPAPVTAPGKRSSAVESLALPLFSLFGVVAAPADDSAASDSDAASQTTSAKPSAVTSKTSSANTSSASTQPAADPKPSASTSGAADSVAKPAPKPSPKPAPRMIPVSGGRRSLDANKWPLWGSPDAKYVFVKMFDYTCPHCQRTHRAIREAAQQLDGGLAIVALPVPLYRGCNPGSQTTDSRYAPRCEIAKIAVALWLCDPKQFPQFHDWMLQTERSASQARAHADALVGREAMSAQMAKSTAEQYIQKHVFLYREAGAGTLPKLVFPKATVVGEITSGSSLSSIVRDKL